jgi:hypothetical protein
MEENMELQKALYMMICVIILALLAISVQAENVTVSLQQNLTIQCNNASQCVTIINGNPVLFSGTEANTTLTLPQVFTYERNVTNIQVINVTVSNATTFNVTTQVINVTNCDQVAPAPIINVSTEQITTTITGNLAASIGETCKHACDLSSADREQLIIQAKTSQANLDVASEKCNAQLNSSNIMYQSLNETCTAQVASAKNQTYQWATVVLILMLILAFGVGYFLWQGKTPKGISAKHISAAPKRGEEWKS